MKGVVVYKVTGSGNDFVMCDGRFVPLEVWTPEAIRNVCDRHNGIGADGLAVLEQGSAPGAVRFHFFNNDGGRAAMCGNAALCATRLAAHLELAPAEGMVLETDAGCYRTRCVPGSAERAEIELGTVGPPQTPGVILHDAEGPAHLVLVGVPHLVVQVPDTGAVDLMERGRALRWDPALGSQGANVNFVSPTDRRSPTAASEDAPSWRMRTYERGVEGETLACGTGAVAVAAALLSSGAIRDLPVSILTASGCTLRVNGQPETGGIIRGARLEGEGRILLKACLFSLGR
ncbi:Diaminopimelate epimerase [bacterium HR33]|nr:Diaminopimelate epimerase [bacterium HR33]